MYCEISEDSGASLFDGREDVITLVEKEVSSFSSGCGPYANIANLLVEINVKVAKILSQVHSRIDRFYNVTDYVMYLHNVIFFRLDGRLRDHQADHASELRLQDNGVTCPSRASSEPRPVRVRHVSEADARVHRNPQRHAETQGLLLSEVSVSSPN